VPLKLCTFGEGKISFPFKLVSDLILVLHLNSPWLFNGSALIEIKAEAHVLIMCSLKHDLLLNMHKVVKLTNAKKMVPS
jgi:hypothetical protein